MRFSREEPTALYPDVRHPTARRHEIAAEGIAESLRKRLNPGTANGREPRIYNCFTLDSAPRDLF